MLEIEKRNREMTYFIDSIFSDKKYSKEIKIAFDKLKEIEKENDELKQYYQFIEKQFKN